MVKYTSEENNKIDVKDMDLTYYQNFLILQEKELVGKIVSMSLYLYYEEHSAAINYF